MKDYFTCCHSKIVIFIAYEFSTILKYPNEIEPRHFDIGEDGHNLILGQELHLACCKCPFVAHMCYYIIM